MARVVVVEDSGYMRNMICAIAESVGHEVVAAATDGVQGHEAVLEHRPDCVLSDLLMPNRDGITMIDGLRKAGWNGPVIVLTADVQKSTAERCRELGVSHFLQKPPNQEKLREALTDATLATSAP